MTQPFTRSSSTSTIKGGGAAAAPAAGDEDTAQTPTVATANPDGISMHFPMDFLIFDSKTLWRNLANAFSRDKGASESLVSPPVAPVKPGILIVTLHEGQGFSLSPHYQQIFNSYFQNNNPFGAMRPNSSSSGSAAGHAASFIRHGRPQSTSSGGINAAPTIHGLYSTKYLPYALLDFEKNQVFVDAVSGSPDSPLWAGDNTAFKFDVSRKTELTIQFYLRNPAARPGAGRSEDIFLGAVKVHPRFEETQPFVEDPKLSKKDNQKAAAAHASNERHLGQLGAEWLDLQFGTGSIKIGVSFVENKQRSLKLEDFDLMKVVGKGSFGKVMQVM